MRYKGLVYNLQTHREHVFHVGSLGTLVHNSCVDFAAIKGMKVIELALGAWRDANFFKQEGLLYF